MVSAGKRGASPSVLSLRDLDSELEYLAGVFRTAYVGFGRIMDWLLYLFLGAMYTLLASTEGYDGTERAHCACISRRELEHGRYRVVLYFISPVDWRVVGRWVCLCVHIRNA